MLHTWGSAMTHHPHVHMIVPGGGVALDGSRWVACKPNFLLPVLVLSQGCSGACCWRSSLPRTRPARLTFFGGACPSRRRDGLRRVSGAAEEDALVRLRQAPLRRTEGRARLSVALLPSRRHLQPPPDRRRCDARHLQGQGLPGRRTRSLHHHDARRRRSSSAASSSTSCPRASTASATTAFSPTGIAPPPSQRPVSCSSARCLCPNQNRPLRHVPMSRARCRAPVPAAAGACTSSRRSRRGRCPGSGGHRPRPRSGSTRHEPCRRSALRNRRSAVLVADRQPSSTSSSRRAVVTTADRRASTPARRLHRPTRRTTHHRTHAHPSVSPHRARCGGCAQSP